jgi:16S rRNA processing protein RimM
LSSPDGKSLVLGRVSGFRGTEGELTVKVISGNASRWVHIKAVVLRGSGPGDEIGSYKVESARAYRDRLVLKLMGVDDAGAAAVLRGREVMARAEEVPPLPRDVYWVERLVGAQVVDAALGDIGIVKDVVETGGVDLLRVEDSAGVETLVPLVEEFVTAIDEASGTIRLTLPEGLRGLNAPGGRETA